MRLANRACYRPVAVVSVEQKIADLCGQRGGLIVRASLREPCVTLEQ